MIVCGGSNHAIAATVSNFASIGSNKNIEAVIRFKNKPQITAKSEKKNAQHKIKPGE